MFDGVRYDVPTPKLCPEERQRRRLAFRNERKLYKRKCDATGESIVSIYPPESVYTVYNQSIRRTDTYNPLVYGQDINFNTSFFEQYNKLLFRCPKSSIQNSGSTNSAYTNYSRNNTDCYMCVGTGESEHCLYSYRTTNSRYCVDCFDITNSSECYECSSCINCYGCIQCEDCNDLQHSFGCKNLQGGEYMLYNKQATKQEYNNFMAVYTGITNKEIPKHIVSAQKQSLSDDSIGNDLYACKNIVLSHVIKGSEDLKYAYMGENNMDSHDINFADNNELIYEATNMQKNKNVSFAALTRYSSRLYYTTYSFYSENCFLCTGLKQNKWCILNKQYTEEEYNKLVQRIIQQMKEDKEWGEFFPASISPFAYNESTAHDYFPLSKEKAETYGSKWQNKNYDVAVPSGVNILAGDEIPKKSTEVDNSILKKIFICNVSGRPFRLIEQELAFYQKHDLPLPRKHSDIRYRERLLRRPSRQLHLRNCDKTGERMLSVYPEDTGFKVYSEEAYQQEIFS